MLPCVYGDVAPWLHGILGLIDSLLFGYPPSCLLGCAVKLLA